MSFKSNGEKYQKFNLKWNLGLKMPLLIETLTHSSYKSIEPDISDNQRLETLGDAVIDLLVVDWLYRQHATNEGILTKSRAEIVQNEILAQMGKELQIQQVLRCAPGYEVHEKDLADAIEAIFGAKYLEGGLDSCQLLFKELFEKNLANILSKEERGVPIWGRNEYNPKNIVNEFFQKYNLPIPIYKLQKKEGTDHEPTYWYSCEGKYQNKMIKGIGYGKTKKEAQKKAASDLYQKLQKKESIHSSP